VKQFAVLLDVVTSPNVGIDFLGASASRFNRLPHRKGGKDVVWRLDSGLSENASVEKQIKALQRRVPFHKLGARKGARTFLSIGVFYDTLTCSVQLLPSVLRLLDNTDIAVEITCYPTSGGRRRSN
jgi:hypothetical protein